MESIFTTRGLIGCNNRVIDGTQEKLALFVGGNDQMGIRIYETANPSNVVLDVPQQVLIGGNLQAHYDQPHKNK